MADSDADKERTPIDPTVVTRPPQEDATQITRDPDATVPTARSAAPVAGDAAASCRINAPGDLINNRFSLIEVLGRGGMGAVYKAVDLRKKEAKDRDPHVAIKLLNPEFAAHPESLVALQREARKSQTLAHPNIVTVYDFDRADDQVYMTMEFLQGKPLDGLLRDEGRDGLDPERARSLLKDICAGLAYAHDHGIAHSDLKPGNVFVAERGAKLLDFGIARAVSAGEHADGVDHEHTYFDPADLGALTPSYASAEMLEGEKPLIADDLYALGLIAYELFTGRHPFDRKTALQAESEGLRPERIKGLSRREWRALERALAFRRAQRCENVHELEAGFEKRRPIVVLSIVGALAVAAGALLFSMQQVEQSRVDEQTIREDVEVSLKHDIARSELVDLLAVTERGSRWQGEMEAAWTSLHEAAPEDREWALERGAELLQQYTAEARSQFAAAELDAAEAALAAAAKWQQQLATQWQDDLAAESALRRHEPEASNLANEISAARAAIAEQARLAKLEAERRAAEEQARREAERKAEEQRREEARRQAAARAASQQRQQRIATLEASIKDSHRCAASTDFSGAAAALKELAGLDAGSARTLKQATGDAWLSCVQQLSSRSTRTAETYLAGARRALPADSRLAGFRIDPCADLKAGGGRARGQSCVDTFASGRGPTLVVVPGVGGGRLAVAKYEVTRADFGRYCKATASCNAGNYSGNTPVTNVALKDFESYVGWLTRQSGFEYRIPSTTEWQHVARGTDGREDPNRNCTLEALGIRKGQRLISSRTGAAQSWGLVNVVGNAAEVAYQRGATVAMGGRHTDPQDRCHLDTRMSWSGQPDATVGLRVVRDVR